MSTALGVLPISPDWSDGELVASVRCGNDAAFEELYSRYSHRICSYVYGMVGDHGRAEDITQEIFIAALRRMRETERPIAFKAWIFEIAKNACIDSFRRTRRAQEVSLDADHGLSSADRGRLTAVTTLDAALDSKQVLRDLRGAFGALSDSHHEILVLRELEGRSYSDIGERLGMSRPVVESTLFRARRRLAEEYDELTSGRRCEFVRNMVDSGPHYSLGIRERRRMARHLAHCQTCRSHARRAGFDESILNMPSVAARIAVLLPMPFLGCGLGAVGRDFVGAGRGRRSVLAFRSVRTLAHSLDQIAGAGAGAGRAVATTAALGLASVGGGIVTASSSQPVTKPHYSSVHAIATAGHGVRTSAVVPARGIGTVHPLEGSVVAGERIVGSVHLVSSGTGAFRSATGATRLRSFGTGASEAVVPVRLTPTNAAIAGSGHAGGSVAVGAAGAGGSVAAGAAGAGGSVAGGAAGAGGSVAAGAGGASGVVAADSGVAGSVVGSGSGAVAGVVAPGSGGAAGVVAVGSGGAGGVVAAGWGGIGDPATTGARGAPTRRPDPPMETRPTRTAPTATTSTTLAGVVAAAPRRVTIVGGSVGATSSGPVLGARVGGTVGLG